MNETLAAIDAFEAAGIDRLLVFAVDLGGLQRSMWCPSYGELRAALPGLIAEDRGPQSIGVFVEVASPDVVQFDDCDPVAADLLRPFAFLIVETSPNSFQVWLRLEARQVVWPLEIRLARLGGNTFSFNTGRLPGFPNRKLKHRRPDGTSVMVRLEHAAPGTIAGVAALCAAGLLPTGWKARPSKLSLQPLRGGWLVRAAARIGGWIHRRHPLFIRWSGVTGLAKDGPLAASQLRITLAEFTAQLDLIAECRTVVSFAEYREAMTKGARLPDRTTVLTFDYGHANFVSIIEPALARYRFPATLFVEVGQAPRDEDDSAGMPWGPNHDRQYLSWREIQGIASRGTEIGLSTGGHHTAQLPLEDVTATLRLGLERLPGHRPEAISFWHAQYRADVERAAREFGIGWGVGCGAGGYNAEHVDSFGINAFHAAAWFAREPAGFLAHLGGVRQAYWRLRRIPQPVR